MENILPWNKEPKFIKLDKCEDCGSRLTYLGTISEIPKMIGYICNYCGHTIKQKAG